MNVFTKSGKVSSYGFACGNVERAAGCVMYFRHCCYFVIGASADPLQRFPKLKDARKAFAAALKDARKLRKDSGLDERYSWVRVWTGYTEPTIETQFCQDHIGSFHTLPDAIAAAKQHRVDFCNRAGIAPA